MRSAKLLVREVEVAVVNIEVVVSEKYEVAVVSEKLKLL